MFADKADQMAKDATSLVQWMKDAPPGPARDNCRNAYTESLRAVYIMAAVISFVALVASMWVKHYDLNQVQESDQGLECDNLKQHVESRDFESPVERQDFEDMTERNQSFVSTDKRHVEKGRVVRTAYDVKKPSTLHRQLSIR